MSNKSNQGDLKIVFLFLSISIFCSKVFAQSVSNNEQYFIQEVWNLFKSVKGIDETSVAWDRASREQLNKGICISGNCQNGFGISIENGRGFSPRYQYEGQFVNGQPSGSGVIVTGHGTLIAKIADIRITKVDGLYKLDRPSGRGFTLSDINFFQNLAFARLAKCDCLTPTYDHPIQFKYAERTEIVNGYGEHVRYEYESRTGTDLTSGLLNSTKEGLYIRAYRKEKAFGPGAKNNPIEYFDKSFFLEANKSMENADFNKSPFDNGQKITAQDLETLAYTLDDDQLSKKGYLEYTRYVGQYTTNTALINECRLKQLTIHHVAIAQGNNRFKIDAYTGTTNLKVNDGDKISIKAYGKIRYAFNEGEAGPIGTTVPYFGIDERFVKGDGFKVGALIAKVGDCDWFPVGDADEWVTNCTGNLDVIINDNNPSNNSGNFIVEVRIERKR